MIRSRAPKVDILVGANETALERTRLGAGERYVDPRNLLDLDDDAWSELVGLTDDADVRLLLEPPDVYSTTLPLPRRAERRARDAVALQIDEIAPVAPVGLRWNSKIVDRTVDHITVRVVMVKTARIDALTSACETHGLTVPSIHARVDGMTLLLDAADAKPRVRSWRASLVMLALVASIPLTLVCGATLLIWSNQSAIDALRDPAAARLRLERQDRAAASARAALGEAIRGSAASRILDDLAGRLPLDASLFAMSRDGAGRVRAEIDATAPETVREALASDPLFHFSEIDEAPQEDGRMRVVYVTGTR